MALLELIQGRLFGVVAHAHRAHFVDDFAGGLKSVAAVSSRLVAQRHAAHRVDDFLKRIVHVFGLLHLVFRPLVVEAQHRNAEFIHCVRVYLAIIAFHRNRFAAPCHANECPVKTPVVIFQGRAVATGWFHLAFAIGHQSVVFFHAADKAVGRDAHATAVFDVVAARKIKFLVVQPPRREYVHTAHSVFIVPFPIHEGGHKCAARGSRGIVQVLAHHAAFVGQSAREAGRFGVKQQPRRLTGTGRQHHYLGLHRKFLHGFGVHVRHAGAIAGLVVGQHFTHHRMGDEFQVAGFEGRFDQHR